MHREAIYDHGYVETRRFRQKGKRFVKIFNKTLSKRDVIDKRYCVNTMHADVELCTLYFVYKAAAALSRDALW